MGLVRPEQTQLLPESGVDLDYFAPQSYPGPCTPMTFLMVSRLLRDKGVSEYVEAGKLVREKNPEVRFQLLGPAGSENRTAYTREEAVSWKKSHGVEYLGEAKDVRPYIKNAHCVILPSYRKGAPRTPIEASASARPVIASDVPGCRAVVRDGLT